MKICGIVVEYNPFHNGHAHHIQKARELSQCDVLVAVMSGNFVQRGEPAILDKWQRARKAIEYGVDCVIELPYIYATQSASHFAKGAIDCLKLAQIDTLVFGSESNNLIELQEMAQSCIHVDHLKESLQSGNSFPKAYGLLAKEMEPNDILGVAYLKELLNTPITPYTIQRTVHYHDQEIHQEIASASAIRKAFFDKNSYENTTPMGNELTTSPVVRLKDFYPYLRTILLTSNPQELSNIFLFNEGIENHLVNIAMHCATFEEFMNQATTRRYTTSRIQRSCIQLLNRVTKEEVKKLPPLDTIRILAFNEQGREFLKHLSTLEVKVASKFAQIPAPYRKLEFRTTLLYTSMMNEEHRNQIIKKEIGGPQYIKSATQ
ncbi:nucleotidyltransferase [Anaerorhabdus furcosa]|uniref:tRNA(Met) cytidine acetate ligase n=1 Tax=Anaerorhabdus furcosa TaxID=118967 RepID=A0A1T4NZI6_9FIRM|nr:nucleotidyltransferase [Anaerorhabdus furcosa]SJZ84601.1 Predicted nucleotidyltransferase [Anaerorhabdus furcosa]